MGSISSPSESEIHEAAKLEIKVFNPTKELQPINKPSVIWSYYESEGGQGGLAWSSESDIQNLVKLVLKDAINSIGLGGEIQCYNELSIFRLRADIWIVVQKTGLPIGVVEVKKPEEKILKSNLVHGQIFDYLLRLKSFHGLEHVFGIVTTYKEWRFCWLENSDEFAISDQIPIKPADSGIPKEEEEEDSEVDIAVTVEKLSTDT